MIRVERDGDRVELVHLSGHEVDAVSARSGAAVYVRADG
jgi:hypothetical protein